MAGCLPQGAARQADVCLNATYEHRVDDPGHYNWCIVPDSSYDAVLFAGLAVLTACAFHFSSLSAVLVLLAGAAAQALLFPLNLGRLGNSFAIWLGITPPELFFFVFLPPLLLDSALSIDWFVFKKVKLQVLAFAFLIVIFSGAAITPFLLYGLNLAQSGWNWQHGALFSSILASTDAVAITAVLHRAGGPESLVTLMEGEALLNDASGLTLFKLMLSLVQRIAAEGAGAAQPPAEVLPRLALDVARLSLGGLAVGLSVGFAAARLVRMLRWHGASAAQENAAILSLAYLTYYAADALLGVSGVVAVVVFGLYGNAHAHFQLGSSLRALEARAVRRTLSFALNAVVFFFAGASCVNFAVRAAETLRASAWNFALFPPVYLSFLLARGACIALLNPLFKLAGGSALGPGAVAFTTWAGLRGAVSLIMAQAVVTDERLAEFNEAVVAQMGLWTALFVLSTLLLNAPLVPAVLRRAGLVTVTPLKRSVRAKAKRALLRFTRSAVEALKQETDEMMRGVDWGAVDRYVDLAYELPQFSVTAAEQPEPPAEEEERGLPPSGRRGGDGAYTAVPPGVGLSLDETGSEGEGLADELEEGEEVESVAAERSGVPLAGILVEEPVREEEDGVRSPTGSEAGDVLPFVIEAAASPSDRRASALFQLSRPSPVDGESSRRLHGLKRHHVSGRWERAVQQQPSPRGTPRESPFGGSPRESPFGGGFDGGDTASAVEVCSPRAGRRVSFALGSSRLGSSELERPLLSRLSGGGAQEGGRTPTHGGGAGKEQRAASGGGGGQEPFAALYLPLSAHKSSAGSNANNAAESSSEERESRGGREGGSNRSIRMEPTDLQDAEAPELPLEFDTPGGDALAGSPAAGGGRQGATLRVATGPPHEGGGREGLQGRGRLTLGRQSSPPAVREGASSMAPCGAGAELLRHTFSSPLLEETSPRSPARGAGAGAPLAAPAAAGGAALSPRRRRSVRWDEDEAARGGGAGGEERAGDGEARLESIAVDPFARSASPEGSAGWSEEVVAEARRRLLAGLKRYFAGKRGEGLLSGEGLRCLNHACDTAFDHAEASLAVWAAAESEVVGGWWARLLDRCFVGLKRLSGRLPRWLRPCLLPPLRAASGALGAHLSRSMLVACECAVELAMALSWSPAALWIGSLEAERAAVLQKEMAAEIRRVTQFIIDRELEAPQRFQAIQSYRAAMAVLRQQERFVGQLYTAGVLDVAEKESMLEPVLTRARQLELRGPTWQAPSVQHVLRALPFLHAVPDEVFERILEAGILQQYGQDDVIWSPDDAAPSDVHVVIYGLIRSSFTDRRGRLQEYFLGSGGVVGLLTALTGVVLPGAGPAVAQRSSLHRGPVAFTIPRAVIAELRVRGARGDRALQQLDLDMHRVAALYVVDRTKGDVAAELAERYIRRTEASDAAPKGRAVSRRRWHAAGRVEVPAAEEALPLPDSLAGLEAVDGVGRGRKGRRGGRRAVAFARGVLADMRRRLRDAELVKLKPGAQHAQRGHVILLQGALAREGAKASKDSSQPGDRQPGADAAGNGDGGGAVHAPVVLPWVWPHLGIAGVPASGLPHAVLLTAGPRGATLLACPGPGSSDAETESSFGSPRGAGAAPGADFGLSEEEGEEEGEGQAAAAAGAVGVQEGAEEPDPGEGACPRLRRVKSRTLPLSAALHDIERVREAQQP